MHRGRIDQIKPAIGTMAKPDILLSKDRVSVVGTGTEVENEIERGVFEISVGEDQTPSIRMSAQQANVNIGGGEGLSAEGDLRINDESGNTRIQMTGADDGNRPADEDRVWVNGGRGRISLGNASDTIHLIDLDADERRVSVTGGIGPAVALAAGSDYTTPGGVNLYGETPPVGPGANASEMTEIGVAKFYDSFGNEGVEIRGQKQSGITNSEFGGTINVRDGNGDKTVEINGGSARSNDGGSIKVRGPTGGTSAELNGTGGNINLGGGGVRGSVALRDDNGSTVGWFRVEEGGDVVLCYGTTKAIRIKSDGSVEFPQTSGLPGQ